MLSYAGVANFEIVLNGKIPQDYCGETTGTVIGTKLVKCVNRNGTCGNTVGTGQQDFITKEY